MLNPEPMQCKRTMEKESNMDIRARMTRNIENDMAEMVCQAMYMSSLQESKDEKYIQ